MNLGYSIGCVDDTVFPDYWNSFDSAVKAAVGLGWAIIVFAIILPILCCCACIGIAIFLIVRSNKRKRMSHSHVNVISTPQA